jgi:hypothetical protein
MEIRKLVRYYLIGIDQLMVYTRKLSISLSVVFVVRGMRLEIVFEEKSG